jgi:hypothetical protein
MENKPSSENSYTNGDSELEKPTFAGFVNGLAAEVMIHLGYFENPISRTQSVNLPMARFSIDLISLLDEKSRGNQTEEERQLFEAVLYTLRMNYLEAMKKNDTSIAEKPPEPPKF